MLQYHFFNLAHILCGEGVCVCVCVCVCVQIYEHNMCVYVQVCWYVHSGIEI